MADEISFELAVANWKAMVGYIPEWADSKAKNLRHAIAVSQVQQMRDAPTEPAWRSQQDDGPLRIVTSRLARSLLGSSSLNATYNVFSTSRTYEHKGGYDESFYAFGSAKDANAYKIHVVHGTSVPYADIHEYGQDKIKARPYFAPGAEEAFQWFREKLISTNAFGEAILDTLRGDIF